jgi:hypothetical protein
MHFRKALIIKMSNLRPLHHKDTIDLFIIGKVSKTNKMMLCKMGNFFKKNVQVLCKGTTTLYSKASFHITNE